jgi:hypothetical protein
VAVGIYRASNGVIWSSIGGDMGVAVAVGDDSGCG